MPWMVDGRHLPPFRVGAFSVRGPGRVVRRVASRAPARPRPGEGAPRREPTPGYQPREDDGSHGWRAARRDASAEPGIRTGANRTRGNLVTSRASWTTPR